jgi:hypothetical protein
MRETEALAQYRNRSISTPGRFGSVVVRDGNRILEAKTGMEALFSIMNARNSTPGFVR